MLPRLTQDCQPIINGQPVSEEALVRHELERARVALALLKSKLGIEGLRALLADVGEQAHHDVKARVEASAGKWLPSTAELEVKGCTAQEFLAWYGARIQASDQNTLLAAHPEHYVVTRAEDGRVDVIETSGHWGLPHRFYVQVGSDTSIAPDPEAIDPSYTLAMAGAGYLDDGTQTGIVLHQFADTVDGFRARLSIYFPAENAAEMIEGHKWHLALEFTNWVNLCLQERRAG